MPVPLESLTQHDYLILSYIAKFDSVSKEQISNQLSAKIVSLDYRIKLLSTPAYIQLNTFRHPVEDSSYIVEEFDHARNSNGISYQVSKNSFHLSPLGKKTLQDYRVQKKSDNKALWLQNAWIPIIVTIATTIALDGLKWLLPQIILWLSNTP